MKAVNYLLIVLTGLFLFVACQKELSVESGFAGQIAKGSLLDSGGNCKNITVNGAYIADSTLTSDNYVTVQVNIASGGSYKIVSDAQNGFSFLDSGFLAAGLQTVKLKATGKPIQAKQTTFSIAFDTTFCSFTVTVVSKTPAVYALVASGSSCSTATIQGTYSKGTALTAANKVGLQVNVTTPGSYAVTTTTVGGMTFSGTGTFTTPGIQTITLQGSGTPTTVGANIIPVKAGSSNCSFSVNVTAGSTGNTNSINDLDSAWQFSSGTNSFHGPFFDVFDTTINNTYGFVFRGYTQATGDTTIQFGTFSTTPSIVSGATFNSKDSYAAFYYTDYRRHDSTGDKIYVADYSNRTTVNTTITISTYSATTKIVTGTFSGTATNIAGTSVPITNGKFRAIVR
ncbi:MAG: hypothetical protein ACR2KZ_13910 [Segetibacter sp.]